MPGPKHSRLMDVLAAIIDSLRKVRAPYIMIGAWALAVWGRPRATMDVDFLVMVDDKGLDRLGEQLIQTGFSMDETWLDWNPLLKGAQLRMQYHDVTVDLMRPRDVHDNEAFKRRKRKRLAGRYCWVVAPEDFILQKLKVGRPRDFEDVLSALERSRKALDFKYLKQWAGRLGLIAELDYLLEE
ncbi:MAG: hypothetical protein V1758_05930 [Pseudomonadota bacterium]